jgi:uncharacterized membrane protein SpoIIM required for sporulation
LPKIFDTLRMLRRHILFAAAVFVGGALLGTLLTDLPDAMMQPIVEMARQLQGRSWFALTVFILGKNALAAMVAILGGFLLGVLTFGAALVNGMVLGRVAALNPAAMVLILPHGVIELTAVTIAWALGFWCAGWLRRPPRGRRLRERAVTSLALFVRLVLPLLAVAAAIEAAGIKWLTRT